MNKEFNRILTKIFNENYFFFFEVRDNNHVYDLYLNDRNKFFTMINNGLIRDAKFIQLSTENFDFLDHYPENVKFCIKEIIYKSKKCLAIIFIDFWSIVP